MSTPHEIVNIAGKNLKARFFEEPFIEYFKKFLELDTKIKLIVDHNTNMDAIKKLQVNYGKNLEIRYFTQDVSGTMRNFVYGKEIAVNGIKILPENTNEPSYIGTAYVNIDDIQLLDDRFNNLWNLAKPVEKTPGKNKT